MTCVVPSGVNPVTWLWAGRNCRTLGSGHAGSAGLSCILGDTQNCGITAVTQSCEGRQPHKLSCSWPAHHLCTSNLLLDICPAAAMWSLLTPWMCSMAAASHVSFNCPSSRTVLRQWAMQRQGHAGELQGSRRYTLCDQPKGRQRRKTEMEDMTQTQATAHAQPIRRTSPTSGVTSRLHGILSPNSESKNKSKNNCLCVAFIVSVGGLQERRQLGVVGVGLLFLFSWPSDTKENMM